SERAAAEGPGPSARLPFDTSTTATPGFRVMTPQPPSHQSALFTGAATLSPSVKDENYVNHESILEGSIAGQVNGPIFRAPATRTAPHSSSSRLALLLEMTEGVG